MPKISTLGSSRPGRLFGTSLRSSLCTWVGVGVGDEGRKEDERTAVRGKRCVLHARRRPASHLHAVGDQSRRRVRLAAVVGGKGKGGTSMGEMGVCVCVPLSRRPL